MGAERGEQAYTLPESVISSKKRTTKHYIRYGSSTIAAEGADLAELIDLSRRVPFDDRGNAEIQFSDISNVMLADYLNKTGSRLAQQIGNTPLQQILEQMNLMTGPAELRYVRNVAAMMFSEHPERFFPYTQVEVVIFPRGRVDAPENHITPLLESGLLEYTHPHAPRCGSQKYKLNPRAEALRLMLQNA